MEQKFNPETARVYHFRYMREYRAICVLWGLLSIIWCILNLVAFVQPQWIGDTPSSPGFGHVGVFQHCYPDNSQGIYVCSGSFTTFDSILNDSFRATTFFVGVSALLMLITVAALLLFFCFKKTFVFYFCGIMELISGECCISCICLLIFGRYLNSDSHLETGLSRGGRFKSVLTTSCVLLVSESSRWQKLTHNLLWVGKTMRSELFVHTIIWIKRKNLVKLYCPDIFILLGEHPPSSGALSKEFKRHFVPVFWWAV